MERERALEIVKKHYSPDGVDDTLRRALETLIPELTESDDERIRKELIALVRYYVLPEDTGLVRGGSITRKQAEAWLEEQKERGPLTKEEEFTLQRIIEHLEDEGCPSEWKDLLHDIYNLPYTKQKEQMLKDAVEGEAHPDDCEIWVNFEGYGYKFNDGDKVKIVIVPIKEDKK